MKRVISIVVALTALASVPANAAGDRMSDARYISATRCLAYADLPELQADAANFSSLRAATEVGYRSSALLSSARDTTSRIRATARRLSGMQTGMQQLREERDTACAGFVQQGLVQLETTAPAS
ncbi:MAG: hypothetical protein QM759_18180 [Terricaulis sp.]